MALLKDFPHPLEKGREIASLKNLDDKTSPATKNLGEKINHPLRQGDAFIMVEGRDSAGAGGHIREDPIGLSFGKEGIEVFPPVGIKEITLKDRHAGDRIKREQINGHDTTAFSNNRSRHLTPSTGRRPQVEDPVSGTDHPKLLLNLQ